MRSQDSWDERYLLECFVIARDSKDPSTKVGAIIVTPDHRMQSSGYNGFPRGMNESCECWERPHKYERVIHAEMNAIINCPFDTQGCTVYCTLQPCHVCLNHLRNAGIRRVVYHTARPPVDQNVWDECSKLFDEIRHMTDPAFLEKAAKLRKALDIFEFTEH